MEAKLNGLQFLRDVPSENLGLNEAQIKGFKDLWNNYLEACTKTLSSDVWSVTYQSREKYRASLLNTNLTDLCIPYGRVSDFPYVTGVPVEHALWAAYKDCSEEELRHYFLLLAWGNSISSRLRELAVKKRLLNNQKPKRGKK